MREESLPRFDPTIPVSARTYDYATGGKDNLAPDRDVIAKVRSLFAVDPWETPSAENRRFLRRAVRFLLEAGVRQFIDIGCGMPSRVNVHDLARAVDPGARVVYVDHDPMVVTHYRALVHSIPGSTVIQADARSPDGILSHPEVTSLIDFTEPVGVLLVAVLHLIPDEEDPGGIVTRLRERVAPGSYFVMSHLTVEGPDAGAAVKFAEAFAHLREPMAMRCRAHIESFFKGLDLVGPGLVDGASWQPGEDEPAPSRWLAAGVARKAG